MTDLLARAIDELRRLPCRYNDPAKCPHCQVIREYDDEQRLEAVREAAAAELREKAND